MAFQLLFDQGSLEFHIGGGRQFARARASLGGSLIRGDGLVKLLLPI